MSKTENSESTETTETQETPEKTFTREQLATAVQKGREELEATVEGLNKQLTDVNTKVDGLTTERDDFKTQVESLTNEKLRLSVGLEKNLPNDLVGRLKGSTKEELEEDADKLRQFIKSSGSFDGGKREEAPQEKSLNDQLRESFRNR